MKQPDSYSCGPTAILNAMKWAGIDATGQHLSYIQFSCRTIDLETPSDSTNHGTLTSDFDRVIRYVGSGVYTVKRKSRPTVSELKRHLQRGEAIAFAYHWEEAGQKGEHFCFISGFSKGLFVCINDHNALDGATICLRRAKTIKKWMKRFDDCPIAWFLTMEK